MIKGGPEENPFRVSNRDRIRIFPPNIDESPEMRSKSDDLRLFVNYFLKNYWWYYHESIMQGDVGMTTNSVNMFCK